MKPLNPDEMKKFQELVGAFDTVLMVDDKVAIGGLIFDSIEDAHKEMQKHEHEANLKTTPEQHALKGGDCYSMDFQGLQIVGRILSPEEIEKRERELGATDEEWAYTEEMLTSAWQRGFRTVVAYSEVTPEGEQGSCHVSQMTPIDEETFNELREASQQAARRRF